MLESAARLPLSFLWVPSFRALELAQTAVAEGVPRLMSALQLKLRVPGEPGVVRLTIIQTLRLVEMETLVQV